MSVTVKCPICGDGVTNVIEHMRKALKIPYRANCILDCDSPSYPPLPSEYRQCGCDDCVRDLCKFPAPEEV